MRKIFGFIAVVVLALGLVGCNENNYEVKFVAEGEVVAVVNNTNVNTMEFPSYFKQGYNFNGWFFDDDSQYNETQLNGMEQIKQLKSGNYVVRGDFSPINYYIEYLPNCESFEGSMPPQSLIYDTFTSLNTNQFTNEGFSFIGWSLSSNGEVDYLNGEQVLNLTAVHNETIRLYAIWSQNISFFVSYENVGDFPLINGKISPPKINTDYELWIDENGNYYDNQTLIETLNIPNLRLYYCASVDIDGQLSWHYYFTKPTQLIIPQSICNISVKSLKQDCFSGQENIISVEFPSSLTSIGSRAFYNCTSILNLEIPSTINHIGFSAFGSDLALKVVDGLRIYCSSSNLQSISLNFIGETNSTNNYLNYIFGGEIESNWFDDEGRIIGGVKYNVFSYLPNTLTNVIILNGDIPSYAFYNAYFLEQVTLADNTAIINEYAFAYCENLKSINFPSSLRDIKEYAFVLTTNLVNISFKSGIKNIYEGAFVLSGVKNLVIPSTISLIDEVSFLACYNLIDVEFKSNYSTSATRFSFATSAFYSNLDGDILDIFFYVPNGTTSLKPYQYYRESAFFLPYASKIFPISSKNNTGFILDSGTLLGTKGKVEGNLVLPNCTTIAKHAFSYKPLLTNISLPTNLVKIEGYAFYNSMALGNISFPNSLRQIEEYAFAGSSLENLSSMTKIVLNEGFLSLGKASFLLCNDVEYIYIPSSVNYLGYLCFGMSRSLELCKINATTIPEIGSYTNVDGTVYEIFSYVDTAKTKIAVPNGFKNGKSYTQIYREHEAFSPFTKHIIPQNRNEEYGIYAQGNLSLILDGQNCFDININSNYYWGTYEITNDQIILNTIYGDLEQITAQYSLGRIQFTLNSQSYNLQIPTRYYDAFNMSNLSLNPDGTGLFNMFDVYVIDFTYEIINDEFHMYFDGNNTELPEYIGTVLYIGTIDDSNKITISIMLNDWQYPHLMEFNFSLIVEQEKDYSNTHNLIGTFIMTHPESSATLVIQFIDSKNGKIFIGENAYDFTYTINADQVTITYYETVIFQILPSGDIFGELFAFGNPGTGNFNLGAQIYYKQ